ncbi:MAG: LptA/OstA family protein [Chthoniobacterales bacterium]
MLSLVCLPVVKAQDSTANTLASPAKAKPEKSPGKPKADDKKQATDPLRQALGGGIGSDPKVPTTTEILADQAFFDSGKSIGIFSGHVIVKDPRFNLQADKLTVYLGKGETQGLDHAVAEGNVGMVREAPGQDGGPPMRSVGRSDTAVYTAANGNVELRGTPRVQSGLNSHIATSPDTVMVINQGGQLTTTGPSRTELRQEPKGSPAPPKP